MKPMRNDADLGLEHCEYSDNKDGTNKSLFSPGESGMLSQLLISSLLSCCVAPDVVYL